MSQIIKPNKLTIVFTSAPMLLDSSLKETKIPFRISSKPEMDWGSWSIWAAATGGCAATDIDADEWVPFVKLVPLTIRSIKMRKLINIFEV